MKKVLLFLAIAFAGASALAQGWPANYGGVMLQGFFWDSYKEIPDCSPHGPEQYGSWPAGVTHQPGYTWATMYGAGWATGEEWQVPVTTWSSLRNCGSQITDYIDLLWLAQSGSTICGPTTTYYKSNDDSGRGGVRAWRNGGTWNYNDGNIITNPDCMGFVPVFYFHHGLVKDGDHDWTYTDSKGNVWTPKSYHGTEAELRQLISEFKAAGTGAIEDVVINHRGAFGTWNGNTDQAVEFPSEYYGSEVIEWTKADVCNDDESGQGTGNPDCGGRGTWARDMDHHSAATRAKMAKFLDFLKSDLGYIGFRYDYARGFEERHFGDYNTAVRPAFSVGEFWGDLGEIKTWIKNTYAEGAVQSAAFDFPLMYAINQAFNNGNYRGLKGAGLIADETYKRYAVTFIDNHDTFKDLPTDGSNYAYQHRTNNHIVEANAFILSMPGTPCLFWPHYMHPTWKGYIQDMIVARHVAGVTNTSSIVETTDVDNNGVEFKIQGNNGKILLQLGDAAGKSHQPGGDYTVVYEGDVARMSVETTALGGQSWASLRQNYAKPMQPVGYPVVDKPSGSYQGGVAVTVSPSSPETRLVYTVDGSVPTQSSTQLTGATTLTFSESTTLKVGVLTGNHVSDVVERTYITDHTNYVDGKITIFVKADDEPNFYLWRESAEGAWEANLNGNWPGGKSDGTKYIDGIKWYYKTVDPVAADKQLCLQLNWGTDASKQSDIRGITNDVFYTLAGNIPTDVTPAHLASAYGTATPTDTPLEIDKATGEYEGYVKATITGGDSNTKLIYCVDQPDVVLTAGTTANASQGTYVVNGAGGASVIFDATHNTNNGKRTHTLKAILVKDGQIIDSQERTYWISGTLTTVPSGINIYVKNMTTGQTPNMYAWIPGTETALNGAWPGNAMTQQSGQIAGQTWYKWHIDRTDVDCIINLHGADIDKTENISITAEGDYYFYYYPGAYLLSERHIDVTNSSNLSTTKNATTIYFRGTDNAGIYVYKNDQPLYSDRTWSSDKIKTGNMAYGKVNNMDWNIVTFFDQTPYNIIVFNKGNESQRLTQKNVSTDKFYFLGTTDNNWSGEDVTSAYSQYLTTETPTAYTPATQTVVTGTPQRQLSELALSGDDNTQYVVSNDLFVEMVNPRSHTIFARTDRGAAFASKPGANQEQFDSVANFNQDDWVEIEMNGITPTAAEYEGMAIVGGTLNGTLVLEGLNKKIVTNYAPLTSSVRTSQHTGQNNYLVANFMTQSERGDLFFVDPQPNEVAKLKYAVFGTDGRVYMHENAIKNFNDEVGVAYTTNYYNGTFTAPQPTQSGKLRGYEEMTVIVKKSGSRPAVQSGAALHARSQSQGGYTIDIVGTKGTITGVEDITDRVADKHVTGVRYYNLMGVGSYKPHAGVNIIVTYYDDGSHEVVKQLR